MEVDNLIESFSEFKDVKSINRETMMNILEDVFKSVLTKKYDGAENFQVNLNSEKWVNDNLKFRSTVYSRKTVADYDWSATDEFGYVSDNRMYTIQTGLEHISKKSEKRVSRLNSSLILKDLRFCIKAKS